MVAIVSLFSPLLAACFAAVVLAQTSYGDVDTTTATDKKIAYFGIVFKDDTEQINAILSNGNNALNFQFLNGGRPILSSNVGRNHTRDPFLLRAQNNEGYYILATDNSLKLLNGNWDYGNKHSSRQITVYKSKGNSLTEWEDPYLSPELMNWQSGGVSAPEAIWDEKEQKYLVTFSSNLFDEKDTKKAQKPSEAQVYYSYTTDFKSFSTAKPYYTIKNGGAVDMTIARLPDDSYIRFFRNDTNAELKVTGQISHDGLQGRWQVLSPTQPYINTEDKNGGPLVFLDNENPALVHVWIDNFATAYRAYESADLKRGFTPSQAPNFLKDMKQGTVIGITQKELDQIKGSIWAQQQQ
ncbi:hypothetical protein CBS101457_004234 [Exobasidium rhododendri]|nr:hypothetical protein CBS101457_004234 [Exobasidium rhododendri]